MRRMLPLFLMLLGFLPALSSQVARYKYNGANALPDPQATPGVVDGTIVADLSKDKRLVDGVEHNICAPDFRTPPFRVATKSRSTLVKVCLKYGFTTGCPGPAYELDDICSIETGCKNVEANLWPQPIAQARMKDHEVEDKLGGPKGLICRGKISLHKAQQCLITDWVECAAAVSRLE